MAPAIPVIDHSSCHYRTQSIRRLPLFPAPLGTVYHVDGSWLQRIGRMPDMSASATLLFSLRETAEAKLLAPSIPSVEDLPKPKPKPKPKAMATAPKEDSEEPGRVDTCLAGGWHGSKTARRRSFPNPIGFYSESAVLFPRACHVGKSIVCVMHQEEPVVKPKAFGHFSPRPALVFA